MSPSLTSHSTVPADLDARQAADLTALHRRDRAARRTRAAFAGVFTLIGAALAFPVLVTIPARVVVVVALLGLAVAGAGGVAATAAAWLSGRYEVARSHSWQVWRWRAVCRWYAPGATVWLTDPAAGAGPLAVLAWSADAACRVPWALVYDGTPLMSGGSAVWLPLTDLTPTPPAYVPRPGGRIGGPR